MIINKKEDLNKAIKSAQISSKVLTEVYQKAKEGMSTLELDTFIKNRIEALGAKPAFLNYDTGEYIYPYSSCISLNYQLVHTKPSNVIVKKGDLITVDLGSIYKGIYSDISYTWEISSNQEKKFLEAGKKSLLQAIKFAKAGNRVGDISFAMEKVIKKTGYTVSIDLVGHGIGKTLHEPPQIPCFGLKGTGPLLKEGQLLAIEVMYMKGSSELIVGEDGFSLDTKDKSLSAQFEHTVLVTSLGPQVLTFWPE